ncbi:hypothetical protein BDR05DRAFT_962902 [Suillus weaverae]|nr:hypothetical protein BDR05DRAFT_962902 [Suillus weaverae]
MSSEYPSHLHVSFAPNATSFKRTFEQFGYDSGSPMTSALQASGSGTTTHNVPTGSSSSSSGNERNKRARSTSSSSVSNHSADSSRSSEYISARSSASLSDGSTTNDQNRRSPAYPSPAIASTPGTLVSPTPGLPSTVTEPQDEDMSDSSGFSLDIPRPAPPPEVVSSTAHETLRSSIERFNEFDSHIAALRRSHSRTPSWHPTASPVLSPHESSNDTTDAFDNWDWTHFGTSPGLSHASGEDRRGQYFTDATTSIGSGGAHTAVPRQVDSLSFQASDGLSRPGYTTSSSDTSNSTRSSNTPPHPSYRPSPSISSSARTNAFIRESDEFSGGSLAFVPSERNNTDALNGPDDRQGVHRGSSSGSSNLSWAVLTSSHPSPPVASLPDIVGRQGAHRVPNSGSSNLTWATLTSPRSSPPVAPSPDVVTRPGLLDSVFEPPTSDLAARPQAARRTTYSDASWRSMSSARTSTSTSASSSVLGDSISHFYAADEERHRGTSNTIQGNNLSSSRSTDRYQDVAARARTVIERSRNSDHPLSEAFSSVSREQAVEDSDEADLSFDRYFAGLGGEDSINHERRRRVTARNRYHLAGESDEDHDDPSHPDSVHEIIQGLHNARGLLERGVETARSLSGSPSRHEPPNPPSARYRFHSRSYTSATTMSSNSLVSESAAEHRRTNARAHLRSHMFNSRPNSDEPPRDSSDISSSTAAARLRRLIASQADSSSNTSSHPLSSGRTSDLPSRPFALNGSGPPSQSPRGGLNEWERVRFSEFFSEHRHPQTRSGNNRSLSRDRNHLSSEDSPDSIFDPVFTQIDGIPGLTNSAEEDAQPPYVYRPPTPPLHTLRAARSRSPPRMSSERRQVSNGDPSTRSHPFSSVNLDMFPPGIYRDSLRRSIQANEGRGNSRVPEPEPTPPTHEPSTMFPFGNSDEDNDSDDMDSYFGILPRRGRERTVATSTRFSSRHMMPEPAASATSLAFGVDSHNTSTQGNSTFTSVRGRVPPLRGQSSDEHLARHRLNEAERGVQSLPLDPFWPSSRSGAPAHNPAPHSWESLTQAEDRDYERMRTMRDMMERYGPNNERSDLASRRNVPQPHHGPSGRPGNANRLTLLPWRSPLLQGSSAPTSSGSSFTSSSSATISHNPYRNTTERPRERQEAAPPEERTPIRTLRQRAGLTRGTSRAEGTRIRSMFRTMARRNMGDYMPDELFDSSYEGLLSLGETLGEARSKATPADVIASLPTGTYQAWAKEDSETRCPICLDDYGHDDPVTKLVECTHWLHKTCLEQWLKTANTCPVCRKKVANSPKCPYKASIMASAGVGGSGSREPEVGANGNHGRASSSDSASGVVAMRLGELINRARRGSNAQSGSGTQQQSLSRIQTNVGTPAEPVAATRFNGGGTHFHHHHHHYLHIHPPRPEQSHGSQFLDPYHQSPSSTASAAQSGTGPRAFPSVQNVSGPRPNVSSRPALSRPTSWFGSMTNRASARRVPEATQDNGPRFPSSPMEVEHEVPRTNFIGATSGFHDPAPATRSTFGVPPSFSVTSSAVFPQTAGSSLSSSSSSSSSTSTTSNILDSFSLATGELPSFHGTTRTNVGSLGSRPHGTAHPNNAAASHFGSFNTDGGLDSRSSSARSSYVRPGGPGSSAPPPWWR